MCASTLRRIMLAVGVAAMLVLAACDPASRLTLAHHGAWW
jgi:hypothetical protein